MNFITRISITLIALVVILNPALAQDLSPSLVSKLTVQDRVDCMIYLREQADLSHLHSIKSKIKKGEEVYRILKEHAGITQRNIHYFLEKNHIAYISYSIVNAIRAELSANQLYTLLNFPEIEVIAHNSPVALDLVEEHARRLSMRSVEWGIAHIRANEVWDLNIHGQGVTIGGQDTGYEWTHATLMGKYRGYDDLTGQADHNYHWHDAIHAAGSSNPCGSNSPEPCDDHNHGTHTMGTMVGDDGIGNQIGVAPGAQWIGCRNMDAGDGTPATYIECFEWFLAPTDLNGNNPDPTMAPHVINNSWSCPVSEGCDPSNFNQMRVVIENLKAAGIVVVVSNGNSGPNCETTNAPPAFYDESFSIGAVNSSADIANFSSRGTSTYTGNIKPDVSAPGVGVRSAIRNNGFATFSGTSMAGPHVAGTVALIISANPNLEGEVAAIEQILIQSAISLTSDQHCSGIPGDQIPNNTFGYGIIDAYEAVQLALGYLPVELISFSGFLQQGALVADLYFHLSSDKNGLPYWLQRSIDLVTWNNISEGTLVSGDNKHKVRDPILKDTRVYYRLAWQDENGRIKHSQIIVIESMSGTFQVAPNPADDYLIFTIENGSIGYGEFMILDMYGRVIAMHSQLHLGKDPILVDLKGIPSGVYICSFFPEGRTSNPVFLQRFVKK